MRPEKKKPDVELSEEEKLILSILEKNDNKMELNSLKEQASLSGKKWDKAMKELASHNLTKIITENDIKYTIYQ
jgi:lysyl-tRNA synthetase class 2